MPPTLVAIEEDFRFAWETRRDELFAAWRREPKLVPFWEQAALAGISRAPGELRKARRIGDADFCALCQGLQKWLAANKLPARPLGLRSGEDYRDPADAPRIATIYNGFRGRRRFAPFRKGDPEGNRWLENDPLYIDWLAPCVTAIRDSVKARWQGVDYFFLDGISWTRGANHVPIKCKLLANCVTDVNAMKLAPSGTAHGVSPRLLLAVANSDIFSFILKKFIAHTWMAQISDLRMMPLVVPSKAQARRLQRLAELAVELKRLEFAGALPGNELAAEVREVGAGLLAGAPSYLRPGAQRQFLATAADGLATVELAVNWEAEKLYGVEGLGPFDEF